MLYKHSGEMSQECKLLEGPAAASAQILLATAAVGALIYKRYFFVTNSAGHQASLEDFDIL